MSYDLNSTPEPLKDLERRAWLSGDHLTAELAGRLEDAEKEIARLENVEDEERPSAERRAEAAEEDRDKMARETFAKLEDLRGLLESAPRLSNRAAIMAALNAAQGCVDL